MSAFLGLLLFVVVVLVIVQHKRMTDVETSFQQIAAQLKAMEAGIRTDLSLVLKKEKK